MTIKLNHRLLFNLTLECTIFFFSKISFINVANFKKYVAFYDTLFLHSLQNDYFGLSYYAHKLAELVKPVCYYQMAV